MRTTMYNFVKEVKQRFEDSDYALTKGLCKIVNGIKKEHEFKSFKTMYGIEIDHIESWFYREMLKYKNQISNDKYFYDSRGNEIYEKTRHNNTLSFFWKPTRRGDRIKFLDYLIKKLELVQPTLSKTVHIEYAEKVLKTYKDHCETNTIFRKGLCYANHYVFTEATPPANASIEDFEKFKEDTKELEDWFTKLIFHEIRSRGLYISSFVWPAYENELRVEFMEDLIELLKM